MIKLCVLQKYDEWFLVVTNWNDLEYYQNIGTTLTRMKVKEKLGEYFQADSSPESKTKPDSSPDSNKS